MLRICHIIHDTKCGGTESMLLKLIGALPQGHEFSVVSLMGCGEIGQQIQALGVPVISLQLAEAGRAKPLRLYRLLRELRRVDPHIVQTWGYHADLVGGLAARLATRASVLWNVRHATLDPALDSKNVLRSARCCGRVAAWVPDRILLNAESSIPVHQAVGYPRAKMQVIPNGFDIERFCSQDQSGQGVRDELSITAGATVIGMCGRFHVHKGQQQFVEVAAQLAARHGQLHFVMVGRGCDAQNEALMVWIRQANLEARVHLLGERTDVPRVLNAMNLLLLPSLTEGMPNVVGEAMACGVPVVATDVGDAGRLIGEHGILVPAGDTEAMTRAAEELLGRSELELRQLGTLCRDHIRKHFSLDAIARQYTLAWRDTLEQRRESEKYRKSKDFAYAMTVANHAPDARSTYRPKLVHVTTIAMTQWLFLRGQFPYMAQQGFEVHSVSSPGAYLDQIQQRDPVTVHPLEISRRIHPAQDARSLYALYRLFRQLHPEIVQLSTPKAALLGAIAAWLARVPVRIYQVRGLSSESERGLRRWLFQRLEQLTGRLCNAHLVNAHSLLEYAQRARILDDGHVAGQGMSNGIDVTRFDPTAIAAADLRSWDPSWNEAVGPVIGFIGRLTHDKGLEDIHAAWRVLREEFPYARLLLVGPWEAENAVAPECRTALENDARVLLTGTQQEVTSFYRCMDVFVYPSHGSEGFPNAPMEAAAMELPVIATRVVGCVDAVSDGVTGRVISPRCPEELEAALRRYLSQPELRQQHGRAGRERIRKGFAPEALWREFHEYYLYQLRLGQLPLPQPETSRPSKQAA